MEVNRVLAPYVDVMIGNEEDFTAALGFEVEGMDEHHSKLDVTNFQRMIEQAVAAFPQLPGCGYDTARRKNGVDKRLGSGLSGQRASSTSLPCGRTWKSLIVLAEVIPLPLV